MRETERTRTQTQGFRPLFPESHLGFCHCLEATDLISIVHGDYLNYEKQQGELPKKPRLGLCETLGLWPKAKWNDHM